MKNKSESTEARRGTQGETKKQLLVKLYPFSHGAWAHTNVSRIALFGRNLAEATSPKRYDRFRAALEEYLKEVFPALDEIAREHQVARLDSTLPDSLRSHADELARIAAAISQNARLSAEDVQCFEEEIPKHSDRILSVLHEAREDLLRGFRCWPADILATIVEERQTADETRGISYSVEVTNPDQMVVADEEDFRRVINWLIDGIRGEGGGRTSLFSLSAGDRWLLEIQNKKLFIPLHLWQEIFIGKGLSGHEELVRVPEIVRNYDGDVCVKASSEAAGTTILLRLRIQGQ